MSRRKRVREMTTEELMAEDRRSSYVVGRSDAFHYGKPESILKYWEAEEPTEVELHVIIRNILGRIS